MQQKMSYKNLRKSMEVWFYPLKKGNKFTLKKIKIGFRSLENSLQVDEKLRTKIGKI